MNIRRRILFLTLTVLFLLSFSTLAWSGECVGVSDGDTLSVMHGGKSEKIRLYDIDCPERGQPFGKRAKQFTSNMIFGKIVDVNPVTKDRYGRTVAWVYVNEVSLDRELLKAGLARHFKRYSKDKDLAELENEARADKIGLRSDPNQIPLWK